MIDRFGLAAAVGFTITCCRFCRLPNSASKVSATFPCTVHSVRIKTVFSFCIVIFFYCFPRRELWLTQNGYDGIVSRWRRNCRPTSHRRCICHTIFGARRKRSHAAGDFSYLICCVNYLNLFIFVFMYFYLFFSMRRLLMRRSTRVPRSQLGCGYLFYVPA